MLTMLAATFFLKAICPEPQVKMVPLMENPIILITEKYKGKSWGYR